MKNIINALFILLLFTGLIVSQNSHLYVPLNIQKTIKKGTRSYTGKPGADYWQNGSDYKINAEILPDSSYLIGNEIITYYNNSPDTLSRIVMRIYQDITKKGALRDWYIVDHNQPFEDVWTDVIIFVDGNSAPQQANN